MATQISFENMLLLAQKVGNNVISSVRQDICSGKGLLPDCKSLPPNVSWQTSHSWPTQVRYRVLLWVQHLIYVLLPFCCSAVYLEGWDMGCSVSVTHWGRVHMHICICKLTIIGSDNGLAPSHYLNQCWNIVNWTLRNKISEILIKIHTFSFKKMYIKM